MEKEGFQAGSDKETETNQRGLGTFAGVFTPSILTILGIILFLRLGYITGSAGVARALVLLALANMITIITSQSLSAVATNLRVKGGGDYYLISRTLGYKFGGSIGIVLYLAQSVSVAFYCIGFAEAFTALLPFSVQPVYMAACAIAVLFILAWMGADYATRFQYGVMALLIAALGSFYIGGIAQWQQSLFLTNWLPPDNGPSFWLLFAVFFPAVTGFTQGVSMSGDLKDPGKSLPLGTFLAVGVSIVVYLSVIIIFAGNLPNTILMEDYSAMQRVSRWAFLIDAGVIAATLSSAMASFMGGPRILQSLASDKIFTILNPFEKGAGESNNPRRALILTGVIALITISLGRLELIAQVVSMFFLISYGLLNYATFYEADTDSPSFRPRFSFFHKYVSLAGAILCFIILLALDMKNGILALSVMAGVYLYLNHSAKPARWADSSRAHGFSTIRKSLKAIMHIPAHQRDWHPNILAFSKTRENRGRLLTFGDWLCGDIGLMSGVQLISEEEDRKKKQRERIESEFEEDIREHKLFCYSRVIEIDDFSTSLPVLLQGYGFGPLIPNTLLTNWYNSPDTLLPGLGRLRFGHNLRTAYRLGINSVIFHCDQFKWETLLQNKESRLNIDIWWPSESKSSRLMLLFAYLVTRDPLWKDAQIRVLSSSSAHQGLPSSKSTFSEYFEDVRIEAELEMVADMHPDTVIAKSSDSGLVFLPFYIKNSTLVDGSGYSFERLLTQLNCVALVLAAEDIDLDAEPEEGLAGLLADLMDELSGFDKQVVRLQREEGKIRQSIEELTCEIKEETEKLGGEAISEHIQKLEKELKSQEQRKEKNFRKMAKVTGKRDDCLGEIKNLGGTGDTLADIGE